MTEENPKRPNAKYSLSKPDNEDGVYEEDDIVYHYSRERRLEKAPQVVKNLYDDNKGPKRFGVFRALVADKPKATLFLSIILMSMVIFFMSIMGHLDTTYSLDGNTLEIKGVGFEGTTIIVIRKTIKRNTSAYSGAVDVAISVSAANQGEDYPVFYHRIFFSLENEEAYRFVVPFDSNELLVVLQTENTTLRTRLRPD